MKVGFYNMTQVLLPEVSGIWGGANPLGNLADQLTLFKRGRLCPTHYCQPPTKILKAISPLLVQSTINLLKVTQINYISRNQLHCRANLNFGLMCKKAKHYWALSTNFLFQFR